MFKLISILRVLLIAYLPVLNWTGNYVQKIVCNSQSTVIPNRTKFSEGLESNQLFLLERQEKLLNIHIIYIAVLANRSLRYYQYE